ncbi:hypothetical protein B0H17DRAFT_1075092 [Mycena rosella]|uniref:F-box domain-containing protein n=1 Tax=Mycena rosella TaxID=1033263 RepID=A0AAD7GA42_MYCRO|nr:hypothetical protein B0H17DRAFT_1075092 [Mycena rosella]
MTIPDSESLTPLLRSNDAPQPPQTALVHEVLRHKNAELCGLGAGMSALQSALHALESKRALLAVDIHRFSGILSPLRRLPPELVEEIFLYFVPAMHFDALGNTRRVVLPWTLAHVCRAWRTVALSLRPLWCWLDLSSPRDCPPKCSPPRRVLGDAEEDDEEEELTKLPLDDNLENEEGHEIETALDFIETCLQRSGEHPLSIQLPTHSHSALPLLDALSKDCERWKEIVLLTPLRPMLDWSRLSRLQGRLQHLRKIVFARSLPPNFQFSCAPNLTELTLVRIQLPLGSDLPIPWSQLTEYCEIRCIWHRSQQRWQAYRQLQNVRVFRLVMDSPYYEAFRFCTLPRLRVVSIISDRYVIRLFDAPALEAASIHGRITVNRPSDYFLGVSPRLKNLRLNIPLTDPLDVLELFPDLTELAFDGCEVVSDTLLTSLTRHYRAPLVPKLEVLRISNAACRHLDCKLLTLERILRARFEPEHPATGGTAPLRRFEFRGPIVDKWVAASLTRLREETQWDMKVGDECEVLEWDDLYLPK